MRKLALAVAALVIGALPAAAETQRLTHDGYGTLVFDLPPGWTMSSDRLEDPQTRIVEFVSPADATDKSWDKKIIVSFVTPGLIAENVVPGFAMLSTRSFGSRCLPTSIETPQRIPDLGNIVAANFDIACETKPHAKAPDTMYLRAVEVDAGTIFGTEGEKGLIIIEYFQHFGERGPDATARARVAGQNALRESRTFIDTGVSYCPMDGTCRTMRP